MRFQSWTSTAQTVKPHPKGSRPGAVDVPARRGVTLNRAVRVLALVLVAASLSNCSMLCMTKLPERPCTSSVVLPVVDTAFAAGSIAALTQVKDGSGGTGLAYLTAGIFGLIFYGSSAYGGFTSASRCSEHIDATKDR